MEALVLLAVSVALLWVGIPVVLVNIGWTKAPEVARSQPILLPPPVTPTDGDDVDVLPKLPSIESYMERPTLPESLEQVTKGRSPVPLPPPQPETAPK